MVDIAVVLCCVLLGCCMLCGLAACGFVGVYGTFSGGFARALRGWHGVALGRVRARAYPL